MTDDTTAEVLAERQSRLVYVAGPITGDPFGCVRQALGVFDTLRALGLVPFLPQLTVLAEIVEHRPYEAWMAYDLDVIAHCAALIRLPGDSPGADREIAHAQRLAIPVYRWPDDADALVERALANPGDRS